MNRKNRKFYFQYMRGWFVVFILLFGEFHGICAEKKDNGKLQTVVIDPGHGGKDPGTLHGKIFEKDLALSIALKLGNYIKQKISGVEIIFTRTKDVFVPLHKRAQIANDADADLFISIHIDAIGSSSFYGTSTYALGLHRNNENLEVAKRENSVILLEDNYSSQYEGFDPKQAESYIIFELYQNQFLDHSLEFAQLTQEQFRTRAGRKDRGVKQSGFLVLRETAMPSVLIECGYITNPNERKFLSSDKGQSFIASAIFRAFRSYKERVDSRSNFEIVASNPAVSDATIFPASPSPSKKIMQSDGIIFSIQIGASTRDIECLPQNFKGVKDVQKIKNGKTIKYFVGASSDYQAVVTQRMEIKPKFPDSFIVAFEDGKPVSLRHARKKIGLQ